MGSQERLLVELEGPELRSDILSSSRVSGPPRWGCLELLAVVSTGCGRNLRGSGEEAISYQGASLTMLSLVVVVNLAKRAKKGR